MGKFFVINRAFDRKLTISSVRLEKQKLVETLLYDRFFKTSISFDFLRRNNLILIIMQTAWLQLHAMQGETWNYLSCSHFVFGMLVSFSHFFFIAFSNFAKIWRDFLRWLYVRGYKRNSSSPGLLTFSYDDPLRLMKILSNHLCNKFSCFQCVI